MSFPSTPSQLAIFQPPALPTVYDTPQVIVPRRRRHAGWAGLHLTPPRPTRTVGELRR
jgi:hypothetical protein